MVSFGYIVQSFSVRIPIQKKPVVELLCENPHYKSVVGPTLYLVVPN